MRSVACTPKLNVSCARSYQRRQKHHSKLSVALTSHAHPGELLKHQRHHELDGYVHTDAHDAFDPDEIEGEHFDSDSDSSIDSDSDEDDRGSFTGGILGSIVHGSGGRRGSRGSFGLISGGASGTATPVTAAETGSASRRTSFDSADDEGFKMVEMMEKVRHDTEHASRKSWQQGTSVALEQVLHSQPASMETNDASIQALMESAKSEALVEALGQLAEGEEGGEDSTDEEEEAEEGGGAGGGGGGGVEEEQVVVPVTGIVKRKGDGVDETRL